MKKYILCCTLIFSGCGHELYKNPKGLKTENIILITLDGIKWYEGYKEIDAIDEFIRKVIEDDDEPDKVRFIRIGEEYEDVVQCGDYAWDFLRVQPATIYVEEQL